MPQRWLHELIDLCTLAESFWRVHKEKDKASKFLWIDHREVRHREAVEWIVGLFRKAGRLSEHPIPENFYHALREGLEHFSAVEIMEEYKELLTRLPPEANAAIQHEAVDEIWSSYDYETKKFVVKEALKTLFEGKSLWHCIGMENLIPSESKELQRVREWVTRVRSEKDIDGLI